PPAFAPFTPVRLLDTRSDASGAAPLAAATVTEIAIAGQHDVPADAVAAVLSVTVTEPGAAGYITVYPCGEPLPLASNVNYLAGQTIANMAIAKIGADGKVCFYNSAATELVVDLTGFLPPGAGYEPITPLRVIDTRDD